MTAYLITQHWNLRFLTDLISIYTFKISQRSVKASKVMWLDEVELWVGQILSVLLIHVLQLILVLVSVPVVLDPLDKGLPLVRFESKVEVV